MYYASAKQQKLDTRLFVRTLVLRRPALSEEEGVAALRMLATQELAASLNILEQAIGDSRYKSTESNHLFFRWLAPLCLSVDALERLVRTIVTAEHASMHCLFVVAIKCFCNPHRLGGLDGCVLGSVKGASLMVVAWAVQTGAVESALSPFSKGRHQSATVWCDLALLRLSSSTCCERDVAESDSDSQIDS